MKRISEVPVEGVLVVGRPDRDDLHDAIRRARARLGRDVNAVVVSASQWSAGDDPFLTGLRSRPMVALSGMSGPGDLGAAP